MLVMVKFRVKNSRVGPVAAMGEKEKLVQLETVKTKCLGL